MNQLTLGIVEYHDIFAWIEEHDSDDAFQPREPLSGEFVPTDDPPGSQGKMEVMRSRLERGLPLWHVDDRPIEQEQKHATLLGLLD